MRLILLLLCLFVFGCSKAEAPGEADTVADPAADTEAEAEAADAAATPKAPPAEAELDPEPAPTVTLVSAGKAPLRELRRSFAEGGKQAMSVHVSETIAMDGGGWDSLYSPRDVVQVIDLETKSVSDDGIAEVELAVRKVTELKKSVAKPNAKQLDTTGVTGSYQIDAQGIVTELTVEPPPLEDQQNRAKKVHKPFLDSMRAHLRWMVPPFPEEPVGVGATWTVVTGVNEMQTRITEEATVKLVKRTKDGVVLRVEAKGSGFVKHDFAEKPQEITYTINTDVVSKIGLGDLVPRSSVIKTKILQAANVLGVDGPEGQLDATTKRTVKIKRAK